RAPLTSTPFPYTTLFRSSSSMVDGPFPEHYEPVESPIPNPLHPAVSASPVAFLYDQAAGRPNRFGKVDEFPYVATSYRLTEHEQDRKSTRLNSSHVKISY